MISILSIENLYYNETHPTIFDSEERLNEMNFTAFLSYVIITSFTPGPSNIVMMNEAKRFGFTGSLRFQIGIISGFITLGVVTSLLTTSLYQWIPIVEPYFRVVGAAYLLYLAWQIAFSKKKITMIRIVSLLFSQGLFSKFSILKVSCIS